MKLRLAALGFFATLSLAAPAHALLCTPILGCECTVTASGMDFQSFTPFAGAQNAEGAVQVHCTGVIDVAPQVIVQINKGIYGTIPARKMQRTGGGQLDYNLYTTSARNVIWGDGTGGSSTVAVSGGLLTLGTWNVTRSVYGRANPTNTTTPGAYTDQVVVRIDW